MAFVTATQSATTIPTSIAPATATIQNAAVRSVAEFLSELGLPILPVAPAQGVERYHKLVKGQKVALFTGKNPSFVDRNGKLHLLPHTPYQKRLPSAKEIKRWFENPANGIGTLGGRGYEWIDLDVKQFESQEECDRAFDERLETHPQLRESWLERTHSGGYRIAVKVIEKPDFTNFALEPGGKHRGEALGEGRFTVLAPTIGVSGNAYHCIHQAIPVEVESLESIGLFSTKSAKVPAAKLTPQRPVAPALAQRPSAIAIAIALEQLGNQAVSDILAGNDTEGDRSASLTKAYKEWCGWENWAANNGIAISGSAIDLAHQAGEALGINADRVDRILKGIDSTSCQPAAQHKGGDEACWKKIRRLDRTSFETAAPASIRASLEASYAKSDAGSKPPSKRDGGGGGDEGDKPERDRNPDRPLKAICEALGLAFEYCVTRQQFDGSAYRNLFGGEAGDWIVIDSAFYRWTGKHWQCKDDAQINKLIADYGEEAFKVHVDREKNYYISRPYENNKHKESAFKYCRSRLERDTSDITNHHLLGFNDCVVDLRTGQTTPHSKDFLLTNIIPHAYEPNSECPTVFREFIADSFGEEMLEIVRAFTSMFLDPTAPFGRLPHLIGQSGGGKGTLGRFWNSLFGAEGAGASNNFNDVSTPESRHQYLTGKKIFGFPDMGGFCQGLRAFYELIDNGAMTGRPLFSPTAYSKCWNVRFWLGSVGNLQIENAGDGWARRAYPIPVRDRKVKPDPSWGDRLEAVKAQVISWALAMPRAERDAILLSPPANERSKNAALEAALYGDSTRSFINLCLRPSADPSAIVSNADLHSQYEAFCKIHGYSPLAQSKFLDHLKSILPYNRVKRAWKRDAAGERHHVSAHWRSIEPLAGVFTFSSEVNAGVPQNPVWVCLKSKCEEGGIEAFEQYWSPPDLEPLTPIPQPGESLEALPSAGVQGVQGQNSIFPGVDSLKPLPIEGVQGVQAVHSESFSIESQPNPTEFNPGKSIASESEKAINLKGNRVVEGSIHPGHPGHPGQALCEPVSAVSTSLDSIVPSLDSLDNQPKLLPANQVLDLVKILAAVDSIEAFNSFYGCYQSKPLAQQQQIADAIADANLADYLYGWLDEIDAQSQSLSDGVIEPNPASVESLQSEAKSLIEEAIAALSACWLVADYRRAARQFTAEVLQAAIVQLDPRERETVERHHRFIARNG